MRNHFGERVGVALVILSFLVLVAWVVGSFYVGMLMAHWDLIWGRYEVKIYGYPTLGARLAALVWSAAHGIHVQFGGCMMGARMREYAHGYNAVIFPAIERRFGPELLRAYGFR